MAPKYHSSLEGPCHARQRWLRSVFYSGLPYGSSTLEDLIRVSAEGPPVSEYDPMPTVDKWFTRNREAGERQRRPMFQRLSKLK